MSEQTGMKELMSVGGRRLLVRPRNILAVKELELCADLPPACRVHIGERGNYTVCGTFEEVVAALGWRTGPQEPWQEPSTEVQIDV
jgi:hypothetical protein